MLPSHLRRPSDSSSPSSAGPSWQRRRNGWNDERESREREFKSLGCRPWHRLESKHRDRSVDRRSPQHAQEPGPGGHPNPPRNGLGPESNQLKQHSRPQQLSPVLSINGRYLELGSAAGRLDEPRASLGAADVPRARPATRDDGRGPAGGPRVDHPDSPRDECRPKLLGATPVADPGGGPADLTATGGASNTDFRRLRGAASRPRPGLRGAEPAAHGPAVTERRATLTRVPLAWRLQAEADARGGPT